MEYITVNGMVWPKHDRHCRAVMFGSERDMEPALELVRKREIVVQAGGNCGWWPRELAKTFGLVYTFEPDPVNYHCLSQNVPANVDHRQAGLGHQKGEAALVVDPLNVGAHYVKKGADFPVITVDSLGLEACDYLCLDIEGYEMLALKGAQKTIDKFHPVVQIEDKGLSRKYGFEKGDAEKWLAANYGYVVRHRVKRDVILN